MSDTGIRQFSCIRQVTDTGNILVTTAERAMLSGQFISFFFSTEKSLSHNVSLCLW